MTRCARLTPYDMEGYDNAELIIVKPMKIVAPMVSMSELAWRMFMRKHKAELCYTPMLNAAIFVNDATYRKTYMEVDKFDRPLVVQFCANDPKIFLKASLMVEDVCDAVELNLGCPQIIAQRGHYGAYLQDEWDLIYNIVSLAAKSLKIPVFCKIRIFDSLEKSVEYAMMLEKAGCKMLTVHGRTREQKGHNTGLANWNTIFEIKKVLHIPVVSNGNIQFFEDFDKCINYTKCDGVMTAEGCLSNPYIFECAQLPNALTVSLEYLEFAEKYNAPLLNWRSHLYKLLHHILKNFPKYREAISKCNTIDEGRAFVKLMQLYCQRDIERDTNPKYWLCSPIVRGLKDSNVSIIGKADEKMNRDLIVQNRAKRKQAKKLAKMKAHYAKIAKIETSIAIQNDTNKNTTQALY